MNKSGKRIAFTQPSQDSQRSTVAADAWVRGGTTDSDLPPRVPRATAAVRMARLTIDLPEELHTRFKTACARERTKMVDEVRRFIEDWTQKHGNT